MLDKVTILITSFLRPGYLKLCLDGIRNTMPEIKVVVAVDDDGYTSVSHGSSIRLPFDSGLTAKRNAAVRLAKTPYALLASDDYDFSKPWVREGIERMVETLDAHPEIDVVVGTYNGKRYEGTLEYVPGEYIKENSLTGKPIFTQPYPGYKIDIGINYFLARTDVLREVPWDETIRPIGGEHGDWFMMMKQAQKQIVFVPGCHVEPIPGDSSLCHPKYREYRWRAQQGHKLMLKKWNIKQYYGF